ncbi:MAG: DMT family transporter [Candidatus Korarchaeota archaeon]|nr:DMT family transporter [Candidatus Korarchaeota archaeon]
MRVRGSAAGTIAILTVAALWGGTFTAMKSAFYSADPMPFLLTRFALALLILSLLYFIRGIRPKLSQIGMLAGLMVFLGFAFQMEGLTGISATKSAFITGLNAPLVPLFELIIFRRKPKARAVLAIFLGVLGLALLTEVVYGMPLATGDLLTLGCAVAWALQIVVVDRASKILSPDDVAFNEFLVTLVLALVSIPVLGEYSIPLDPVVVAAVLYSGILATVVAFYLQAWAQERISPESAALGLMAEPVFAYAFAWLLLGEFLSPLQLIGALLILVSIPLAS